MNPDTLLSMAYSIKVLSLSFSGFSSLQRMFHLLFKLWNILQKEDYFVGLVKKHDIQLKPKSYKLGLLGELVI